MSFALIAMTISAWSFSAKSILILLSGSKPGNTREAWKSSNSLPPNSKIQLAAELVALANTRRLPVRYTSDCQKPIFFMVIPLP